MTSTTEQASSQGFAVLPNVETIPKVFRDGFGRLGHVHCSKYIFHP